MKGCVADRQLRRENPMHPAGRRQRRLVLQHALAGAQDGPVAPRHHLLLGAQDDVTIADDVRREERDEPSIDPFLMRALRVASRNFGLRKGASDGQWHLLEHAPRRRAQHGFARQEVTPGLQRGIDPRKIGVARCLGMIRLVQAKERPCRLPTRLEGDDLGLDHRAGDLVLEPLARQIEPGIDLAGLPILRPEQLHGIGGEAGGTFEAAVRDPRVPAALRQILPAHDHRPAPRMSGNVVVDVLRRVGLVVHEEATVAQAHVLHEDRITRHGLCAGVRDVHRQSQSLCCGCSQSETWCCTLWVVPAQVKRSAVAPKLIFAPGPTASATAGSGARTRRYRRAIPPSSGEPCTWLISVRPRSCRCSIAKMQPLGRTLSDRPDWFVIRRRPRSPSPGVSKVRAAGGVIRDLPSPADGGRQRQHTAVTIGPHRRYGTLKNLPRQPPLTMALELRARRTWHAADRPPYGELGCHRPIGQGKRRLGSLETARTGPGFSSQHPLKSVWFITH